LFHFDLNKFAAKLHTEQSVFTR